MDATIMMHEVLVQMDTGRPFNMAFVTADRKRGTGGELKEVTGWCKVVGDGPDNDRQPGQTISCSPKNTRHPDHFQHRTVNIYNPNDPYAHITKVHWRLITFFNGKRVLN